jgi:hypothetical protein
MLPRRVPWRLRRSVSCINCYSLPPQCCWSPEHRSAPHKRQPAPCPCEAVTEFKYLPAMLIAAHGIPCVLIPAPMDIPARRCMEHMVPLAAPHTGQATRLMCGVDLKSEHLSDLCRSARVAGTPIGRPTANRRCRQSGSTDRSDISRLMRARIAGRGVRSTGRTRHNHF